MVTSQRPSYLSLKLVVDLEGGHVPLTELLLMVCECVVGARDASGVGG